MNKETIDNIYNWAINSGIDPKVVSYDDVTQAYLDNNNSK